MPDAVTPLFPAIRAALDALGISPPGHRDSEDEAAQKLAAWTALRDAVDHAELRLLGHHSGSAFTQWCHPDSESNAGYVQGLRYAIDALGIDVPEAPTDPPPQHHYLSTGCYHGDHDYCRSMTGLAGAKRPAVCKFCSASCQCPCHTQEGQ